MKTFKCGKHGIMFEYYCPICRVTSILNEVTEYKLNDDERITVEHDEYLNSMVIKIIDSTHKKGWFRKTWYLNHEDLIMYPANLSRDLLKYLEQQIDPRFMALSDD